jgi:hypothetical protein
MVPPELLLALVPSPVIMKPPEVPVLFKTMPLRGSVAPELLPEEMLWNVSPLAPIVVLATFNAVAVFVLAGPVVALMVLPEPCTVTVPPPVASKPTPPVVLMTKPPLVKLMVAPVLEPKVTAALVPVGVIDLLAPLKLVMPPVLLDTLMPVPVDVRLPEKVLTPPAVDVMFTTLAVPLVIVPV